MRTGHDKRQNNLPHLFNVILLGLVAILKRMAFKDAVLFKYHNIESLSFMNEFSPTSSAPTPHSLQTLFCSGVCFNLFSDYGLGKKLKPLILDLFKDLTLDTDKYLDNIYYQEIIRLSPHISYLIFQAESTKQNMFTYEYAIQSLNIVDKISSDRLERLLSLFSPENNLDKLIDFESKNKETTTYTNANKEDIENPNKENIEGENQEDIQDTNKEEDIENPTKEEDIENPTKEEDIEVCVCGFCQEFRKYYYQRDLPPEDIIRNVLLEIQEEVL